MQGPPFATGIMGSPVAPPIKKQRAGNTPDTHAKVPPLVSRRRAELQKLQQGSDQPTDIMDRARSSIGAPPPGGPLQGGYNSRNPGSAVRGGGRPPSTTAPSAAPPKGAPVFGMQPPRSVPGFAADAAASVPPAPPVPRQVFPSAPGSPTGASRSEPPINITQSPSRPNAAITAAAVKSPLVQPKEIARRLDVSFSSASANRSKSVPPSRPPPPPPPPPLAPEDDIVVGKAPKAVKFLNSPPQPQKLTEAPPKKLPLKGTPHPGAKKQAPPPEATSTPEEICSTKDASITPVHPAAAFELENQKKPDGNAADGTAAAAKTHLRPQDERVPSPLATARRDLLRNMRAFADSPPEKQNPAPPAMMRSPEQDERPVATKKAVGFLSPLKGSPAGKTPRSKRRVATPHPKRRPSSLSSAEQHALLTEAAGCATFLYEGPGQSADFIVRRPYGLATEQDFWFRAGQLSAKLYAKQATVDNASTLEVVANIHADGSFLTIYGESQARHQTDAGKSTDFDNVEEQTLGTVNYIDKDANEKEYSLDELYDLAVSVREHYASSVLAGSESLRLRGAPIQPPQQNHTTPTSSEPKAAAIKKPETCDKAVSTDNTKEPSKEPKTEKECHKKQAPAMPDDSSPDILGSAFALFFSSIFSIMWFIVVGLPLRIVSMTLVLAASVVLLAFFWLQLADLSAAVEMGATMRIFTNQAGIL